MSDQLSLENYSPFEVEKKWQEKWESLRAFSPNPEDDGEPFCVVIPPPNVTGSLHMGHAFNTAVLNACPICCLLYTSPSPRDATLSRMPSSA